MYEEKEAQKEDLDFFHEIGKGAEWRIGSVPCDHFDF